MHTMIELLSNTLVCCYFLVVVGVGDCVPHWPE